MDFDEIASKLDVLGDRVIGAVSPVGAMRTGIGLYDYVDDRYGPGGRAKWARENNAEVPLGENSIDFIPGSRATEIGAKTLRTSAMVVERASQAKYIKGYVGKDLSVGHAIDDAFKGTEAEFIDILKGTKNASMKPTYRVVDGEINNGNAHGVFIPSDKLSRRNNIYNAGKRTIKTAEPSPTNSNMMRLNTKKVKVSPGNLASTKSHEFDHDDWYRKYGGMGNSPVQRIKKTRSGSILNSENWSSKPWEINAQAKQIQQELKVLKGGHNAESYDRLEELVQNTSPYVDDFIKQYPDELGDQILLGMDFLDNTRRVPGPF